MTMSRSKRVAAATAIATAIAIPAEGLRQFGIELLQVSARHDGLGQADG